VDALARLGAALLPVGQSAQRRATPILNYTYERSRTALGELARTTRPDPCEGVRLRYSDPVTGGWPTPTVGAFLQHLPKGFSGAPLRVTDGTVYVAVEGRGRTIVDGIELAWGPKDIFVVPGWCEFRHLADEDAVLFSLSDRPVQQALGLWREARPTQA
jgi:gentisate 1,2-dioxygenase